VGYSIANWSESQSGKSHTITFEGNTVNYANRDGVTGNSWWIAENMKPVAGVETNRYDPNLNASILPEQLVGRARLGLPPTNPGEDRPGNGELELDENEVPDNDDKPNFELPKINNHPSITIYLDLNNRVCINVQSRQSSAMVVVADINGNILYNQPLNRYHTVLPNENVPGTYYVYVKNADREHLKTITLR
jgi:hypothetical protein